MPKVRIVAAALACLAVSALAQATASKVQKISTHPENANLFIFREKAEPTLIKVRIEIDGRVRAKLGNKSYTALSVVPGLTFIKANWPSEKDENGLPIPVEIKPNKKYYFKLTGNVSSIGARASDLQFSHFSEFQPFSKADGANRIATCCKYRAPDD